MTNVYKYFHYVYSYVHNTIYIVDHICTVSIIREILCMTGYNQEEETNRPDSSIKSNTSVTSVGKHKIMISTLWVEVLGAWSSSAVCSALYHPFINECKTLNTVAC